MSACPNWRELLADRFDRPTAEPEGWGEALAHFDGCPICRREACAIDPTLVFRRLPAPSLDFDVEAERMMLAVAGMRASERVMGRATGSFGLRTSRGRGGAARWARWGIAAGLAATTLFLGRPGELPAPGQGPLRSARIEASASAGGFQASHARLGVEPAAIESAVEDLGRPNARIYQLDGERLSVVMIVDEKLDV